MESFIFLKKVKSNSSINNMLICLQIFRKLSYIPFFQTFSPGLDQQQIILLYFFQFSDGSPIL